MKRSRFGDQQLFLPVAVVVEQPAISCNPDVIRGDRPNCSGRLCEQVDN
jgi:hypothetical protein